MSDDRPGIQLSRRDRAWWAAASFVGAAFWVAVAWCVSRGCSWVAEVIAR